jgi:hypothetical protein
LDDGPRTWLVRVYNERDPETKKRNYPNQTIPGGLRDAQAHLNQMLGERYRGRNLDSSKQTLKSVPGSVCGETSSGKRRRSRGAGASTIRNSLAEAG